MGIDDAVRESVEGFSTGAKSAEKFCLQFCKAVKEEYEHDHTKLDEGAPLEELEMDIVMNHVKQSPLYSLAAIQEGIYVIGMKDQFNIHDLPYNPMRDTIKYVADDMGFILYD